MLNLFEVSKMDVVNGLGYEAFCAKFGSLFENTPLVAASVWENRPFADPASLHQCLCDFVRRLPPEGKAGILRCHPDLAGKLALEGHLSADSMSEQKSAGLLDLSQEEMRELQRLNDAYKEKFGWPFVICVRENKVNAIFQGLQKRLSRDRAEELETGIEEVCKIAWHRLNGTLETLCKL